MERSGRLLFRSRRFVNDLLVWLLSLRESGMRRREAPLPAVKPVTQGPPPLHRLSRCGSRRPATFNGAAST